MEAPAGRRNTWTYGLTIIVRPRQNYIAADDNGNTLIGNDALILFVKVVLNLITVK